MVLTESVPKRQRKKSQRDSVSSDTINSPKQRCNSVSEDDEGKRKKHKVNTAAEKRHRYLSAGSQDGA